MSVHVTTWVYENTPDDVTPAEMLVLLVLADHANSEGGLAYPSVERIARMSRISKRGVQYALRRLVERGALQIQHPATNKRPTVYCFPAFRGASYSPQAKIRGAMSDVLGVQPVRARGAQVAPEPSVNRQENRNTPHTPQGGRVRVDYSEEYETYWRSVARREPSKAEAYKAYVKAREEGATHEEIMAGLRRWLKVWDQLEDKSKIPHATTWLRQRRWTVETPIGSVSGNGKHPEQRRPSVPSFDSIQHRYRKGGGG
jgi:DNA-binding Lrp family transcriptional regulator